MTSRPPNYAERRPHQGNPTAHPIRTRRRGHRLGRGSDRRTRHHSGPPAVAPRRALVPGLPPAPGPPRRRARPRRRPTRRPSKSPPPRAAPDTVASGYAGRWSIEVTNRDAKQALGGEDPQSWKRHRHPVRRRERRGQHEGDGNDHQGVRDQGARADRGTPVDHRYRTITATRCPRRSNAPAPRKHIVMPASRTAMTATPSLGTNEKRNATSKRRRPPRPAG